MPFGFFNEASWTALIAEASAAKPDRRSEASAARRS
jgi:hypothetical protein